MKRSFVSGLTVSLFLPSSFVSSSLLWVFSFILFFSHCLCLCKERHEKKTWMVYKEQMSCVVDDALEATKRRTEAKERQLEMLAGKNETRNSCNSYKHIFLESFFVLSFP